MGIEEVNEINVQECVGDQTPLVKALSMLLYVDRLLEDVRSEEFKQHIGQELVPFHGGQSGEVKYLTARQVASVLCELKKGNKYMQIYSHLENQSWDGYETLNGIRERILKQLHLEKMNVPKSLLDFNKHGDLMEFLKENYVSGERAEIMGYKGVIKRIELPKIKGGSKGGEVINCFISDEPVSRDVFEGNSELVEQSISGKKLKHSLQILRKFMRSVGDSYDEYIDDYIKYLRDEGLQYSTCRAGEDLRNLLGLHVKYWTHDKGKSHGRDERDGHEILDCSDSHFSGISGYFFLNDGYPDSEDLAYLFLIVGEQPQNVSEEKKQVIAEEPEVAVQAIGEQPQNEVTGEQNDAKEECETGLKVQSVEEQYNAAKQRYAAAVEELQAVKEKCNVASKKVEVAKQQLQNAETEANKLNKELLGAESAMSEAKQKFKLIERIYEYDKLEAKYGKGQILEKIQGNKDMVLEYMKKNCVKIRDSNELGYDGQEVEITLPDIKGFKGNMFKFFISNNFVRRAKVGSYSDKLSTFNYIGKLFVYMYGFMQELGVVDVKSDLNYENDFYYSRGGSELREPRCASMWKILQYIVGIGKDKFWFTKPNESWWNVCLAGGDFFTYFFNVPYEEIGKKGRLFIPLS